MKRRKRRMAVLIPMAVILLLLGVAGSHIGGRNGDL